MCVCAWKEGGEEVACLLNHSLYPSLHPPIYPSIHSSSTSSSLVVCRLEGRPPCSDTLRHTQTHTSAMCHYQFHLPLPVIPRSPLHLPTLALFPLFFSLSLSLSLHPSLSSQPPHTVCHRCWEERKMLRPTKVRIERRKQRKESKRRR